MKNYIERVKYGSLMLLLSTFGIPFIPFVPIAVLCGMFNLKTTNGLGDMLGSIGFTVIGGIVVYGLVIVMLLRHSF